MVFRFQNAAFAVSISLLAVSSARAQQATTPSSDAQALRAAIEDLKKDFDQRLAALEARLSAVEKNGAQPAAAQAAPALPAPAEPSASTSAAGSSVTNAKVFNPDMAVIGDFLGALGRTTPANVGVTPDPLLQMHE